MYAAARTEDTLRQHLDAVDWYQRKYKWTFIGAGVAWASLYAAFFYFAVHDKGIRNEWASFSA